MLDTELILQVGAAIAQLLLLPAPIPEFTHDWIKPNFEEKKKQPDFNCIISSPLTSSINQTWIKFASLYSHPRAKQVI
jgi:hypothetical protein